MRFHEHQDQARAATRRLLLLFLLTVALTVLAANAVLALLWSLQFGNLVGHPRWFFETNSALCAGFILGGSWLETLQLRRGGAYVAEKVGARDAAHVCSSEMTPSMRLPPAGNRMTASSPSPAVRWSGLTVTSCKAWWPMSSVIS